MKFRYSHLAVLVLAFSSATRAEESFSLNAGVSIPKSILGVSYTSGRNEINAGLKGLAFNNSGDFVLQPGLTYSRYFTDNGFYGSLTYAPAYRKEEGWEAGDLSLGAGKTFQWTSWGVNLDAGVITPAYHEFANTWSYWLGIGGSYRFQLN